MPPYSPVKSKSQSRKLFALAERGEISEDDARGKTRAADDFSSLPERKSGKSNISGRPGKRKSVRKPRRHGPNRSR